MKVTGSSTWSGGWRSGAGTVSTDSPALKAEPYSFNSRFDTTGGTGPEELLAASIAACFNQALANNLGMLGFEAESVIAQATVEMGFDGSRNPIIAGIAMTCTARVPNISILDFQGCAERARARLLVVAPSLDATTLLP